MKSLTDAGERGFWRQTTKCDDYGRFDANPEVVLSRCFELRPPGWTVAKMAKVIEEWETAGLIHRYDTGNGHLYGHFVKFRDHQRERESKPKFPDPPCGDSPQAAAKCRESRLARARSESRESGVGNESRETRVESRESGPTAPPGSGGFRIPESVVKALDRCPILGRCPRLQTPVFWQAEVRANPGVRFGEELLKAEAWLTANPAKAPRKDHAGFIHRWLKRATRPEEE